MHSPDSNKLRLGFIGSGGMADAHLHGLANAELFPDIEIAAFCDVVLERAQAQAAKYGALAFSSPFEMMADASLDACFVLLPPFAHGDAERACLEGKIPFLVEKPIGLDAGVLEEIRREVQLQNLITSAGYMNRYQPSVQAAKAAFQNDRAVMAMGGWFGGPPLSTDEFSLIGQWWVIKEKSGGQMVEQVTHTVDLVRYFLGDAVEVYAHATQEFNKTLPDLMPNYNIDDAMTTTVKFQSGALATILSSTSTAHGDVFLDVLGMKTTAKFEGWGHDLKLVRQGAEAETVASDLESIWVREDRAFVDAVKSGDASPIKTDYADAFKTAMLTLAANKSAETGRPVELI